MKINNKNIKKFLLIRRKRKTTRKKDKVAKQDELGCEVGGELMEMGALCWTLKDGEMDSQREEAMP